MNKIHPFVLFYVGASVVAGGGLSGGGAGRTWERGKGGSLSGGGAGRTWKRGKGGGRPIHGLKGR